jgi:excisionase family DNA binding protein
MSRWQLRQLVAKGQLPVIRVADGSRFLFDQRDLDGFIERSKCFLNNDL